MESERDFFKNFISSLAINGNFAVLQVNYNRRSVLNFFSLILKFLVFRPLFKKRRNSPLVVIEALPMLENYSTGPLVFIS